MRLLILIIVSLVAWSVSENILGIKYAEGVSHVASFTYETILLLIGGIIALFIAHKKV